MAGPYRVDIKHKGSVLNHGNFYSPSRDYKLRDYVLVQYASYIFLRNIAQKYLGLSNYVFVLVGCHFVQPLSLLHLVVHLCCFEINAFYTVFQKQKDRLADKLSLNMRVYIQIHLLVHNHSDVLFRFFQRNCHWIGVRDYVLSLLYIRVKSYHLDKDKEEAHRKLDKKRKEICYHYSVKEVLVHYSILHFDSNSFEICLLFIFQWTGLRYIRPYRS